MVSERRSAGRTSCEGRPTPPCFYWATAAGPGGGKGCRESEPSFMVSAGETQMFLVSNKRFEGLTPPPMAVRERGGPGPGSRAPAASPEPPAWRRP